MHKYRGFAGAIRSIDAHLHEPYVVGGGIDRFICVHNVDTKVCVKKVRVLSAIACFEYCRLQIYCKARLNTVLLPSQDIASALKPLKVPKDEELLGYEDDDMEDEPEVVTEFFDKE